MIKMLYALILIGLALVVTGLVLTSWPIVLEGVSLVVVMGVLALIITRRAHRSRQPGEH